MFIPSDEDFKFIPPERVRYECQDCCFSTTSIKNSGVHDRENNHTSKEVYD